MSSPEYITHLSHVRGDGGSTAMLAGTRSRLYCNTGLDGNWRLLRTKAGGYRTETGVPETRWRSAQVGNIVLLTNGVDRPEWWSIGTSADPATGNSTELIEDLVALDISSVRVIGSWRGFVFIGNVVSEGNTYANRIYWSDFNDPMAFTPLPGSLAGYVDLGADEKVLAMAPLGGQYRVYTDKAIYDVNLVGGDEVFNFREIYRGPSVLRFENTLIAAGSAHIYGGEDTLYMLMESDRTPRKVEWLHRAAGAIYNGVPADLLGGIPDATFNATGPINRSACHAFVGGYDESEMMLWMSWPSSGETVPSRSLVVQLDLGKASIVDTGFTAFCSHIPSYSKTVRKWLADAGICPPVPDSGEGNPASTVFSENTSLASIRNADENPYAPPDEDSLCALAQSNPDIEDDCTPCGSGYKFVMASAQDKCLKEYSADYYAREMCVTQENQRSGLTWTEEDHPTTVADYAEDGYFSMIQTDAQDMGTPSNKTISRFAVEYDASDVPDSAEAVLHAFVGYGAQPRAIIWQWSAARPIDRLSSLTEEQMSQANVRPNRIATFPFFRTGAQLAYRLMVGDAEKGGAVGGEVSLNEMSVTIRESHHDYF
jgi:hypothetical protein